MTILRDDTKRSELYVFTDGDKGCALEIHAGRKACAEVAAQAYLTNPHAATALDIPQTALDHLRSMRDRYPSTDGICIRWTNEKGTTI